MKIKAAQLVSTLLLGTLLLGGCMGPSEENTGESTETVGIEAEEEAQKPEQRAESFEELSIIYEGNIVIYQICNSGDYLYFTSRHQEQEGIYEMPLEGDRETAALVFMEEDLVPMLITADAEGNLYTVFRSADEQGNILEMALWKLTTEGEVLWTADMTCYVPEQCTPWAIAADDAGFVYIRISNTEDILFLVYDHLGQYQGTIANAEHASHIDALGRTEQGCVYAVLGMPDQTNVLVKLNGAERTYETLPHISLPDGAGLFSCVSGRDDRLMVYGQEYGIYAYDLESGQEEHRPVQEFPCAVDGAKCCFLEDGRLLVVLTGTQHTDGTVEYQAEGTTLYYVPLHAE